MPDSATDLINRIRKAAAVEGFKVGTFGRTADHDLIVLTRSGQADGPHIYVSTGIHGDEPAGPEAIFRLLKDSACLPRATWTIFPLLNPDGYRLNSRDNADGLDLNRDYRYPTANESTAHRAVIDNLGPIDLTLSLHEDWEAVGFYLYELNSTGKPGIAQAALEAAGKVGPIDLSDTIDERPSTNGVIQAPDDFFDHRDDWPEQIYLYKHFTDLCYTFETPSGIDLETRINMQVEACRSALGEFCRNHRS
jgi:predicted deacylase